jgi:hypothetical protein
MGPMEHRIDAVEADPDPGSPPLRDRGARRYEQRLDIGPRHIGPRRVGEYRCQSLAVPSAYK